MSAKPKDIATTHAQCRTWGHAWTPYTVEKVATRYVVRLKCMRCSTIRAQHMTKFAVLVGSNVYKYAEGYLMPGGGLHTAEGRRQIRAEVLKMLLAEKE